MRKDIDYRKRMDQKSRLKSKSMRIVFTTVASTSIAAGTLMSKTADVRAEEDDKAVDKGTVGEAGGQTSGVVTAKEQLRKLAGAAELELTADGADVTVGSAKTLQNNIDNANMLLDREDISAEALLSQEQILTNTKEAYEAEFHPVNTIPVMRASGILEEQFADEELDLELLAEDIAIDTPVEDLRPDVTGLQTLIGKIQAMNNDENKYSTSTWNTAQKTVAAAIPISKNAKATPEVISKMFYALKDAVTGLASHESLSLELQELNEQVKTKSADVRLYDLNDWQAILNAQVEANNAAAGTDVDSFETAVKNLRDAIANLRMAKDIAKDELQKTLDKTKTLGSSSMYDGTYQILTESMKRAREVLENTDSDTADYLFAKQNLDNAIKGLKFATSDPRFDIRKTLDEKITEYETDIIPKHEAAAKNNNGSGYIFYGKTAYDNAYQRAQALLQNLNPNIDDLKRVTDDLITARKNLTINDGQKDPALLGDSMNTSVWNAGMAVDSKQMPTGRYRAEISGDSTGIFLTQEPQFLIKYKMPASFAPIFDTKGWEKYVNVSYDIDFGLTKFAMGGGFTSGNKFTTMTSLDKLANDEAELKASFATEDGKPVLTFITKKATAAFGNKWIGGAKGTLYLDINLQQFLDDGHTLPRFENGDDKATEGRFAVAKDHMQPASGSGWNPDALYMEKLNSLKGIQEIVELPKENTPVVEGTNYIGGTAVQNPQNREMADDDYWVVLTDKAGNKLAETKVKDKTKFQFGTAIVIEDAITEVKTGVNLVAGEHVFAKVERRNAKYGFVTSSDQYDIKVGQATSPEVSIPDGLQQNDTIIKGTISTLLDGDKNKITTINPDDMNLYKVQFNYFAPGQTKPTYLGETTVDRNGNYQFKSPIPLQYTGRVEAQAYVYQGITYQDGTHDTTVYKLEISQIRKYTLKMSSGQLKNQLFLQLKKEIPLFQVRHH